MAINRSVRFSGALLASLLCSCGGGGGGPSPDAAAFDAAMRDAAAFDAAAPPSCTSSGPPRGVVVAVQGSTPEIRVMSLAGGQLVDPGLHFTGIMDPQFVTMREDGAEAVVAWGGFGVPYGIVAVTLSPDGTSGSIGAPLQLGTDLTPEGVTYVSNDRIVLAASGPTHQLVTLDRGGGGFAETTRVAAPGNFPVQLERRPGTDQAVMARVEFGVDTATSVYLLGPGPGGAYTTQGAVAAIAPPTISIGAHPGGALVYSPADNPADMVSPSNLKATGLLHLLAVSGAGLVDGPPVQLPSLSVAVAVAPNGSLLTFETPVYELDPNGQPNVTSYVLLTVPLDGQGMPGAPFPESPAFTALLFNDMQLAPSGHMILALELDPQSTPDPEAHPVEVRFQSAPGQWDVCQSMLLSGASHVAIAP
jgi:hypothetical protein